jgi:hypothetical protein
MPTRIKRFLHRRAVVVSILFLTIACVAGLVVRARAGYMAHGGGNSNGARPSPTQKQKLDGVISLTLMRYGFEPAEITEPAGHHLITVLNRSGLRVMALHLDRVGGNRLHDVRVPMEKSSWRQEVDLTPGEYELSEASDPGSVCKIVVTAR